MKVLLLNLASLFLLFLFTASASSATKGEITEFSDDPRLAGHFSGRVVDADGKPVSNSRVFVTPISEEPIDKLKVRAVTGADGRFEFAAPDMTHIDHDGLPARLEGVLSAIADGYAPDWHYVWNRRQSISRSARHAYTQGSFELRLPKDDVPIQGQFLDADGRPLVNARVRITNIAIPPDHDLEAFLAREIKRSPLGCVPNYERTIAQRPHLLPEMETETRTDDEGRFVLPRIGRDRIVTLSVEAPSVVDDSFTVMTRDSHGVYIHQGGDPTFTDLAPAQPIHGATFTRQLRQGRKISGIVRDNDTGKPIPGMLVGLGQWPRDGIWSHAVTSDTAGRFTITGFDPIILELKNNNRKVVAIATPGVPYQSATAEIKGEGPVVVECRRGIPFRLRVVDEEGQPVAAEVFSDVVLPNKLSPQKGNNPSRMPLGQAARMVDGAYHGFVVPGPCAVFVKTPALPDYRPAYVDPKAFFVPGRTDWDLQDWNHAYGTQNRVTTFQGWLDQCDYAAIVLVNPRQGSGPLELTATIGRERPRQVTLIDPAGMPVVTATAEGMIGGGEDELRLRASTFVLTKLHPNRTRRITFFDNDRKLIGFLSARGDGDSPYTVHMQGWGTVKGRILGVDGKPISGTLSVGHWSGKMKDELDASQLKSFSTDGEGRFRIDKLIPGERYSAALYPQLGEFAGMAFEKLIIRPGEIRDLGDIRAKQAVVAMIE
jgi:hypothetical protein